MYIKSLLEIRKFFRQFFFNKHKQIDKKIFTPTCTKLNSLLFFLLFCNNLHGCRIVELFNPQEGPFVTLKIIWSEVAKINLMSGSNMGKNLVAATVFPKMNIEPKG